MGCDVSLARKVLPSSMLVLEYFITVTKIKLGKKKFMKTIFKSRGFFFYKLASWKKQI